MFGNLTGWHFLIVLAIVLLLFGATKLPALARSVGQSMKVFKDEMKTEQAEAPAVAGSDSAAPTTTPAPSAR